MGLTHSVALVTKILVILIKDFRLDKGIKCSLNTFECLFWPKRPNTQWNVEKDIYSSWFSITLKAFHVIFHFALVKFVDKILLARSFKSFFKCIEHHSAKLLNVVLLKSVIVVPSERLSQILSVDWLLFRRLQIQEKTLELIWNTFSRLFVVVNYALIIPSWAD